MLANILNKVRIILVNTSHPGNIGSTARAMKTMGLTQLVLVSPKSFPDPQAIAMSSHADDILDNARVVSSLKEALEGCCLAIGTSARSRAIDLQPLDPKTCAEKLIQTILRGDWHSPISPNNQLTVALVFGREDSGLTNEELLHCHYHVTIPSNPEYSSLNLAAAVQVLCYELRMASISHEQELSKTMPPSETELPETVTPFEKGGQLQQSNRGDFSSIPFSPLATIDEVEQFYEHLETLLVELAFLKKENTTLMSKIRRIFNRIQLEKPEINILRGILTAVQYDRKKNVSH